MAKPKSIVRLALILLLLILLSPHLHASKPLKGCIEHERTALLSFKEGLEDPSNRLSTWTGEDCCEWKGVACSNKTGHVVRLDLHNTNLGNFGFPDSDYALIGKLSSSLIALSHLNYLDLSNNFFNGSKMPEFIGSMIQLRYLNMSGVLFSGDSLVPPQLGNLSNLIYLDLKLECPYSLLHANDLAWLRHLPLLEYLDMSFVNISTVANWIHTLTMLPSLKYLYFEGCDLQTPNLSPNLFSNLSNLVTLDISWNNFGDTASLYWISNLTSLKNLDISWNDLNGTLLPGMFNKLCNIRKLDLSGNEMNIDISEFVHGLPQCLRPKLQSLSLSNVNLVGNLSSLLEHMTSLTYLDLSFNNLTGPIPYLIQATRLNYLDLSVNLLSGVVSENHLANLPSLVSLSLGGNSLVVEQNCVPPITLRSVDLSSCNLGPEFPRWINRLTNIIYLDISNTSIVDKLPNWFRNISSHLLHLDMSNNQISGHIHENLDYTSFEHLTLQNNRFEGTIPPLPQSLLSLDLSNNILSGPLPSMFRAHKLVFLALHNNLLSGTIPASICQCQQLVLIDLSSNLLNGPIPLCWSDPNLNKFESPILDVLALRNNSLSGVFPSFLKYCEELTFLDLSYNEFSGKLPPWIGDKFPYLSFLLLRSNLFSGNIPVQITQLYRLQVLDLAHNNFFGTIPSSVSAFNGMVLIDELYNNPFTGYYDLIDSNGDADSVYVQTKGTTLDYNGDIIPITCIDLSFNSIMGEIPEEISTLIGLISLNLSGNHLSGNIPGKIGAMKALESLDLSNNYLSGEIPPSLSNINSLSYLNLSYNNLSGRIPSGNQLQTLDDPSIYIGNNGLCGPPLSKNCSGNGITIPQGNGSETEDRSNEMSLFLGICIGFILGLWLVFCVFLFKRSYRVAYFRVIDDLYDWTYVFVVLSWKRTFGK